MEQVIRLGLAKRSDFVQGRGKGATISHADAERLRRLATNVADKVEPFLEKGKRYGGQFQIVRPRSQKALSVARKAQPLALQGLRQPFVVLRRDFTRDAQGNGKYLPVRGISVKGDALVLSGERGRRVVLHFDGKRWVQNPGKYAQRARKIARGLANPHASFRANNSVFHSDWPLEDLPEQWRRAAEQYEPKFLETFQGLEIFEKIRRCTHRDRKDRRCVKKEGHPGRHRHVGTSDSTKRKKRSPAREKPSTTGASRKRKVRSATRSKR